MKTLSLLFLSITVCSCQNLSPEQSLKREYDRPEIILESRGGTCGYTLIEYVEKF